MNRLSKTSRIPSILAMSSTTKLPRVLFIESLYDVESPITRGLRAGATAAGWETDTVFLTDASGRTRTTNDVRMDLLENKPDTVCFLADAPLDLEHLWEAPSLTSIDKISLWFNDYHSSPKTLARPEIWTDWQKNHGVRVGIWDGYWRRHWKALTGADAFPVHLAADPRLLHINSKPFKPEWNDRAVFIGTIPSLRTLETFARAFPAPLVRLLEDICNAMRTADWPIRPYGLFQVQRSLLNIKQRMAIDALLQGSSSQALWNRLLSLWGKRIARLRGLTAVAEVGPIAILSGHGTESYADEHELRNSLPVGTDFVYADTRSVPASSLSTLFHTGKWQIQITDPQSIEGGLPSRVFECGACGVPFLSDGRPELTMLFPHGSGLVIAKDELTLQNAAARLFAASQSELRQQGRQFHQSFLQEHTWETRWKQITREPQQAPIPSPKPQWSPAEKQLGSTSRLITLERKRSS